MSNKYTTYWLGAGASANALPVVNMMDYCLSRYINLLYELKSSSKNKELLKFHSTIVKIDKIINYVKAHYSIDTYAKKLFLTDDLKSYNKLKHLINTYILFEQHKFEKLIKDFDSKRTPGYLSVELNKNVNNLSLGEAEKNI